MQNENGVSDRVQRGTHLLVVASLIVASAMGCGGGGSGDGGSGGSGSGGGAHGGASGNNPNLEKFSFFVLSLNGARALSGSPDGFGGDLRHGETGAGAGLRGADKICREAAEAAMPGAGAKAWRAFLSTTEGPVHAKDRVGSGPWYDALSRLVASDLSQLLKDRPGDADLAIRNDLPNEFGVPNGSDGSNNHAILTGSATDGTLYEEQTPATGSTCNDWTSKEMSGEPRCGHSWPRGTSGTNWISSLAVGGCAPCVTTGTACVGSTGGYGGIYCFVTNAP